MKVRLCAGLVAGVLMISSAHAATLINGDFEQPGTGQFTFLTSNFLSGWTYDAKGTESAGYNPSGGNGGAPAEGGNYYISWGHSGGYGGTLSQTFTTAINQAYSVSYYLTQQQIPAADQFTQNQSVIATAYDGATPLGGLTTLLLTPENQWNLYTFNFVATSTSTTLTFFDATPANGGGNSNWGLDTVSVNAASPPGATPLPAALPMFLGGAGLVGWVARRKKRSAAAAA